MTHRLTTKSRFTACLITSLLLLATSPLSADGTAVAEGSWTKKSQTAKGTWKITQTDAKLVLSVSADFKTRKAPDLKIFLSPLSASEVQSKTATAKSLFVAELPKFKGGFEITLPEGTDLADYRSVLIHCEQFTKLWVAADL